MPILIPPPELSEVSLRSEDIDILRQMRQMVEDTHWTKNAYEVRGPSGKSFYCITGLAEHCCGARPHYNSEQLIALHYAQDSQSFDANIRQLTRITVALMSVIRSHRTWRVFRHLEGWNDSKQRRKIHVLSLIDKTIARYQK